jgi:spore germination protein GerM
MRPRVLLALVAVAGLVGVGCGVPVDDSPRAIAEEEVPEELAAAPTTTTSPTGGGTNASLYFVEAQEGRSVLREEASLLPDGTPRTVLDALVATIPEDLPDGVTSSIPEGTVILGTDLDEGVLTVDLSEEFEDVSSELLIQAVGQLVFTATAAAGVSDGVLFSVEGEARSFPDGDGSEVTGVARRSDYATLLPDT